MTHHFNRMQDKNYMINWIYAEKVFDKIQHPFMIKTQQSGYGGNILWRNKAVYDKPTTNNILNDEKLKAFDLRSRTRQGCPHASLLFNTVVEILARANRKERGIKGIQLGKKQHCVCSQMRWSCLQKNLKTPSKLLKLTNK